MKLYPLKNILLLLSLTLLLGNIYACGGDDSDDGSNTDNGNSEVARNACGVLGLSSKSYNKIINGTQCEVGASPVVFIQTNGGVGLCTGSLITSTQVLTAAHCFDSAIFSLTISQGVGTTPLAAGTEIIIHPDFERTPNSPNGFIFADVAIVNLDREVGLPVMPILLSAGPEVGDTVSIFGYGLSDTDNSLAGEELDPSQTGDLHSGQMRLTDVSETHVRARFTGDYGSNTCMGDSGGPMTLTTANGTTGLLALTSGGDSATCSPGDNSDFARVAYSGNLNFIATYAPNASYN